jgi:hypothetical protein
MAVQERVIVGVLQKLASASVSASSRGKHKIIMMRAKEEKSRKMLLLKNVMKKTMKN